MLIDCLYTSHNESFFHKMRVWCPKTSHFRRYYMLGVHCALLSWNENVRREVLGKKWTRSKGGQLKGQAGRWYCLPVRVAQTDDWIVETWRTYMTKRLGLACTSNEPVRSYRLGTPVAGTPVPTAAASAAASGTGGAAASCVTVQQQLSKLKAGEVKQKLKDLDVPGLAKTTVAKMQVAEALTRLISETLARAPAPSPATAAPQPATTLPGTASGSDTAAGIASGATQPAAATVPTVVISAPNFPQPYVMDMTKVPKRRAAYPTKKVDGPG